MKFRKSKKIILSAALLVACTGVPVLADGVAEKPYLSLGADLTASEKKEVLALLDVDEDDLDEYTVVEITNEDEHEYLDNYLSADLIGSRALSSVLIEKTEEGSGIEVSTSNISYCTEGMYQSALTTAGIEDASVKVAGPFEITGTAALVGAMNAYEEMTGDAVSEESKDAATNELVVTGELAEELEDSGKAEEFVALLKEKVLSSDADSAADIEVIIEDCCNELNIEISDSQKEELTALMEKIDSLDLDVNVLKEQASQIYDKLSSLDVDSEGFFSQLMSVLNGLLEKLRGLF